IVRILEEAGFKVGSTNTIFFKVGDKEWPNDTKQGMPGRFKLQKYLRRMVDSGCSHAVIEVTSEGILQSRQWGIAFDEAVFTNLSPEHIESHGSYKNYRAAKAEIFKSLAASYHKPNVKKIIIANGLETEADYFLQFPADEKYKVEGSDEKIKLQLAGEFMMINAHLALVVARALNISPAVARVALEKISEIPGRVQVIKASQGFTVMIDYAHEPRSFEAILSTGRALAKEQKLIVVFGVTGGGRDQAKRSIMGEIAAKYADYIVLTTDDPYNDDPIKLIADIVPGLQKTGAKWQEQENWWRIADRREAIQKTLQIAKKGDIILLLGKGSEAVMVIGDKHIPWSDYEVAQEALKQLKS
ncbi:MAG: Mur ligase family protein, partial [Candidatus Komeilibacteria bacterium]|nr:Mur ligase family protein [Candidatus Komeilibacteria bacterium]